MNTLFKELWFVISNPTTTTMIALTVWVVITVLVMLTISSIIHKKTVYVVDYGLVGDGITDDINAIDEAIIAAPDGWMVEFPPSAMIRISRPINIPDKYMGISGSGCTILLDSGVDHMIMYQQNNVSTFKSKLNLSVHGYLQIMPDQNETIDMFNPPMK